MVNATIDAIDIDLKTGTTLGFYTHGEERPTVLILAAMDGMSSTCVYTSYLLKKHLENVERIDGSVTLLPVSNPLPFRLGTKVSPLDSVGLDTVFPGDEHGSVTERTAWEIWRRASNADYVIQLMTGSQSCLSHVIGMHRTYIHVRNLASQLGLPLVCQSPGTRGSLTTEAAHEGIPAVSIEMRGSREEIDAQAALEVKEAILNFLRIKDMLPGERIETSSVFTDRLRPINLESEGFFLPSVHLGEEIRAGAILGQMQDQGEVTSPFDGVLVSLSHMRYAFEGDVVAQVAMPLVDQRGSQFEDESESRRRKW
jgi:predicted deacylase